MIRLLLLWMHILFAIIWVGGILFVGWGVFPASKALSYKNQRRFLKALMEHTHLLLTTAGIVVIGTGLLLGTIFGPIYAYEQFLTTSYGQKLLIAFTLAFFALLWGIFFGYKQTMQFINDDDVWTTAEKGDSTPLTKAFRKIALLEIVEIICFLILIYIMVIL